MKIDFKKYKIPFIKNAYGYQQELSAMPEPDNGVITLTQCNAGYSPIYDVETDCMLAYVYGIDNGFALQSWAQHKHTYGDHTVLGLMVAINRDSGEYLADFAGNRGMKDVQTRADGSYRIHSVMNGRNIYYMVPTKSYVDYKWKVVQHYLNTGLVRVIAFEEPEFWNDAGYSEGFQEEWEEYYQSPFIMPETSAEATYKSQRLKIHLFYNAIRQLSIKIKQHYPGVQVMVATHSVDDYCAHGIATGVSLFGSLESVDGIIGQTWSDGVVRPLPFAGEQRSNPFAVATVQYRSYASFMRPGQFLYLLQDPASDNPAVTGEWKQESWRQTVVASMLQNDTTYSQFTIWPQRAFAAADPDYRSIQLNVYKFYQEMNQLSGSLYAGAPGIAFAMSDSAGWCIGKHYTVTGNCLAAVFGVTMQWMQDCILPEIISLDTLTDEKQLEGIRLLVLTYDGMKPLHPETNIAIARFVQKGGRLLYIGGQDDFDAVQDTWWVNQKVTPLSHLLSQLNLIHITTESVLTFPCIPDFAEKSLPDGCLLTDEYAKRTLCFSGREIQPLLTVGQQTIGFTADVGKGRAVVVGIPSSYYAQSQDNEHLFVTLCQQALLGDEIGYAIGDALVAVRGRYVGLWGTEQGLTLEKNHVYLDLFDPMLRIVQGGTLKKERTAFLYEVTDLLAAHKPRILFTGGVEVERCIEGEDKTVLFITQPNDSYSSTRLFCAGCRPASVTAVTRQKNQAEIVISYDASYDVLLIRYDCRNVDDPATITVHWE